MTMVLRYGWQGNPKRKAHIVDRFGKTLCLMENSDQSGSLVGFGAKVPHGRAACKVCLGKLRHPRIKRDIPNLRVTPEEMASIRSFDDVNLMLFLSEIVYRGWKAARKTIPLAERSQANNENTL